MAILHNFSRTRRYMGGLQNGLRGVPLVLAFAAMGYFVSGATHAATFISTAEAESGTQTGNYAAGDPQGASGGGAVKFGAANPSPQPTPPPSTGSCALPNYPDASCTGVPAGTNLTVVNGDVDINTANTVIDSKDIRGCVSVNAPGVVIRKSKITCTGFLVVYNADGGYSGTGLLIEDSEISCNNTSHTAVSEANFTITRGNIHGCENGLDVNQNVIIQDSYIHDMVPYTAATDPHIDGIQFVNHLVNGNSVAGALNVTIKHNSILIGIDATSAIISGRGADANILIQDNLVAGGGYTIYCEQDSKGTNYRVINNHFSRMFGPKVGSAGPWTDCQDETEVTGNVYHETGLPLPL